MTPHEDCRLPVAVMGILAAVILLAITLFGCELDPIEFPDVSLDQLWPCDDDRDCLDDDEMCLAGECRPLCETDEDCSGGRCGEPVGEDMGRRVCWEVKSDG